MSGYRAERRMGNDSIEFGGERHSGTWLMLVQVGGKLVLPATLTGFSAYARRFSAARPFLSTENSQIRQVQTSGNRADHRSCSAQLPPAQKLPNLLQKFPGYRPVVSQSSAFKRNIRQRLRREIFSPSSVQTPSALESSRSAFPSQSRVLPTSSNTPLARATFLP